MKHPKVDATRKFTLINGLRGIAVLMVLGFHFNVPFFDRGYWGVDLFFWISGFLITGGFISEYAENRELNRKIGWIDLRYYFIRRVRRILPLSLLVLSFVVLVVWIFADSSALTQSLRRVPRILTFTLNLQLQSDSQDYFLSSNQDYGLLHYWSLSVEEQIYILSPFLFLIAVSFHGLSFFKLRLDWYNRVLTLNLVLVCLSFWLMLHQNAVNSSANYYSVFSRFWEFGLGSATAVLWHQGKTNWINSQARTYISQASPLIILGCLVFLDNNGFGPLVVIPLVCISIYTLFNLKSNNDRLFTQFLNLKVLQFFGDIAFPLYLIHWPAMILLRSNPNYSSLLNILLYLVCIILVAYLLHVFVEQPLLKIDISRFKRSGIAEKSNSNSKTIRRNRRKNLIIASTMVILLAGVSYPDITASQLQKINSFLSSERYGTVAKNANPETSLNATPETYESDTSTSIAEPGVAPKSRQALRPPENSVSKTSPSPSTPSPKVKMDDQWSKALEVASTTYQIDGTVAARQKNVLEELKKSWFTGCLNSATAETACVLGSGEKEAVLLGDSFAFALKDGLRAAVPTGWRVKILTRGSCLPWDVTQYNKNGSVKTDCADHAVWVKEYISSSKPELIIATGADQWLENSSLSVWQSGYKSAIEFYSTHSDRVLIVSAAPGSGNLMNCVTKDLSLRGCFGTPLSISNFVAIQKKLAVSRNYEYLNLVDYLCVKGFCPAVFSNVPVYADGNHFSSEFSRLISQIFIKLKSFK